MAPAELEGILLGHEEVADACVVAAHDRERGTEVPRAYVVAKSKPGTTAADRERAAAAIADWLAARVANHKRLRGGVRFVDEIPKNASGKLLRRVLRDRARQEDREEAEAAGVKATAKL